MTYEEARIAYREGRMSESTFLAVRKVHDATLATYDEESGATALAAKRIAQWAAEDGLPESAYNFHGEVLDA